MSTQTEARPRAAWSSGEAPTGNQHVVWPAIGWEGYEALLNLQGERARPQILYRDGDVTLTAPSHIHELWGDRLGSFVRELLVELDIPSIPTREVTFRRGPDEVGVQPDDSFYLANHGPIAAKEGRENIDLRVDPPPDLAIEVVDSHKATRALEVYGRLGVPEVWVCDENRLAILVRQADGGYKEVDRSLCLPFLSAAEMTAQVQQPAGMAELDWIDGVRRWIREVLVPRVPPP